MRILCATGFVLCDPEEGLGSTWVGWNPSTVQRWVFTQSPLESSGSDQDREGTCLSLQFSLEAAGTTLTCSLCPSTEIPALHQGAPQGDLV